MGGVCSIIFGANLSSCFPTIVFQEDDLILARSKFSGSLLVQGFQASSKKGTINAFFNALRGDKFDNIGNNDKIDLLSAKKLWDGCGTYGGDTKYNEITPEFINFNIKLAELSGLTPSAKSYLNELAYQESKPDDPASKISKSLLRQA